MRRALLCATAISFGLIPGPAANAATISIETDKAIYNLGETITLTITATIPGGPAGPSNQSDQAFVIVAHDPSRVTPLGVTGPVAPEDGDTPDLFTSFSGSAPWTRGGNEGKCAWALGRDNQCLAWDQAVFFGAPGDPAQADAGIERSILQYTADTLGLAAFRIQDSVGTDFVFFDQGNSTDVGTAPPGVTVEIVPEPTSGALLGLGLLGLSVLRQRRAR